MFGKWCIRPCGRTSIGRRASPSVASVPHLPATPLKRHTGESQISYPSTRWRWLASRAASDASALSRHRRALRTCDTDDTRISPDATTTTAHASGLTRASPTPEPRTVSTPTAVSATASGELPSSDRTRERSFKPPDAAASRPSRNKRMPTTLPFRLDQLLVRQAITEQHQHTPMQRMIAIIGAGPAQGIHPTSRCSPEPLQPPARLTASRQCLAPRTGLRKATCRHR